MGTLMTCARCQAQTTNSRKGFCPKCYMYNYYHRQNPNAGNRPIALYQCNTCGKNITRTKGYRIKLGMCPRCYLKERRATHSGKEA